MNAYQANVGLVSYSDDQIKNIKEALKNSVFIGLSDVPDIVWKLGATKRGRENPNHFADMDERSAQYGKTLIEWCTSKSRVDPDKWNDFYASLQIQPKKRGLLPFRGWQLFDLMVAAAAARDFDRYVCAAGVLAHYVGDACQPLHASRLYDGHSNGHGHGIHDAYENTMIDKNAGAIIDIINSSAKPALAAIPDGRSAGYAIVKLMRDTFNAIPPEELIDLYAATPSKQRVKVLWDTYGTKTAKLMVKSAAVLAAIWQGAWTLGVGGVAIAANKLVARNKNAVRAIYLDRTFAESAYLTHMTVASDGKLVITIPP